MPWLPPHAWLSQARWRLQGYQRASALHGAPKAPRLLEPEGVTLWTDFYLEDLAAAHPLPLGRFERLVRQRGFPDFGNPISSDLPLHFEVHPGGFLSAEVEAILVPAETDHAHEKAVAAQDRVGLLLCLGCPLISARAYWADEDMRFACALALSEGWYELSGGIARHGIQNALLSNLLESGMAPGLMLGRALLESARHPSPSVRAQLAWRAWRAPKPIPAPPVGLLAWRELRQQATEPQPAPSAQQIPEAPGGPSEDGPGHIL